MSDLLINSVGVGAGLCSIASFVPQIVKIWREKAAEGVSLAMLSVTLTTFLLWTCYGALLGSWPIAVSNGVCFVLVTVIVCLRLKFGDGAA